jgi:hypothetical protein
MTQTEIPRSKWVFFLDEFSKDHQGVGATLEMSRQNGERQVIAGRQIFLGASADEKDLENRIAIFLGNSADNDSTHTITAPDHLWLDDGQPDSGAGLVIHATDGTTTRLRLHATTSMES